MISKSLEAKHISRSFGAVHAVKDVSLTLEAGQVMALLGPSGSGKSTLLRMLAGLEVVDSGEIFASGQRVASPHFATPAESRGIGLVFQDFALFPHLTALGNVTFGLHALDKDKQHSLGLEWLGKVGLADRSASYPHQLSGGEQQRVALARALAPEPSAVLMDEPFSGLDPHLRADLQQTMLAALREANVGALIVSHDTEEALAIADYVAIMDRGHLIQAGVPQHVFSHPNNLQAARALGPVWTFQTRAQNGEARTPFGSFTSGLQGELIVAARPDATQVKLSPNGAFVIRDIRGVGRFVTVTLAFGTCLVQARIEADPAFKIGMCADVSVAETDVFVFQA
jgi:iron(III) transport system ATP-binding protein